MYIFLIAVVLFSAAMVYIAPLRKRPGWGYWLFPMLVLFYALLRVNLLLGEVGWLVCQILSYLAAVLMVNRCTKISLAGDFYCAVWILVSFETVCELWLGFRMIPGGVSVSVMADMLSLLIFTAAVFFLVFKTIARWMPQGDLYQIGPRQLASAILLGGLCIAMSRYFLVPQKREMGLALIFLLCQIYCISLLYLQTELFKKSQMSKDLEVMNFLYDCEQEQYAAACQNVSMVAQKCEELERAIEQMQQSVPDFQQKDTADSLDEAERSCSTVIRTGNAVLDIVMTEKTMLAEFYGIQMNCVADGKLLDFMEAVDIYAVFSNALDNSIEAVQHLHQDRHIIDVLVHESQNFLVINISNPLISTLQFEEDLPVTTKKKNGFRGYGLKVLRRAIEKYDGIYLIDTAGERFTLKVLIPLRGRDSQ